MDKIGRACANESKFYLVYIIMILFLFAISLLYLLLTTSPTRGIYGPIDTSNRTHVTKSINRECKLAPSSK